MTQSGILTASIAPAIPPAVNWVANPTGFLSPLRDIFTASSLRRVDEGETQENRILWYIARRLGSAERERTGRKRKPSKCLLHAFECVPCISIGV